MPSVPYRGPVVSHRTSISSDESDPSGSSAGAAIPTDSTHCHWFCSGGTAATVEFWVYNGAAWCSGGTQAITGNSVLRQVCAGERTEITLTGVSGTWTITKQFAAPGA